jgi:divalent metal cation (Fe/Co/Zn/Cd) transporter
MATLSSSEVALGAGIAAGSIALVGFGADSLIEVSRARLLPGYSAGSVVPPSAPRRRAQRLVASSYFVLSIYIVVTVLARAKRRVRRKLRSVATVAEAGQNRICAYLSIALLVGLLANAVLGWWWADPVAALVIASLAANEGREAWSGDEHCCG